LRAQRQPNIIAGFSADFAALFVGRLTATGSVVLHESTKTQRLRARLPPECSAFSEKDSEGVEGVVLLMADKPTADSDAPTPV
jgi:hypothetical protein